MWLVSDLHVTERSNGTTGGHQAAATTEDPDKVHTVFDGLEFRVLRAAGGRARRPQIEDVEDGFDLEGSQLAPGEVAGWLKEHLRG